MDKDWLDRLAAWAKEERRLKGFSSADALADAINRAAEAKGKNARIGRGAVYKWEGKQLKNGLKRHSIEALAAYRDEDFEETEAWLEGKPFIKSTPSLQERVETLEAGIDELKTELEELRDELEDRKLSVIPQPKEFAELLTNWRRQFNEADRAFHLEFFELSESDLKQIEAGRPVTQKELQALQVFLGQDVFRLVKLQEPGTRRTSQLVIRRQTSVTTR